MLTDYKGRQFFKAAYAPAGPAALCFGSVPLKFSDLYRPLHTYFKNLYLYTPWLWTP